MGGIMRQNFDSPWKKALVLFFKEFLELCHPQAAGEIDWGKGHEFLDKELEAAGRGAKLGVRRADKLARVWRKCGGAEALLHLEIQNSHRKRFPEQTYVYNYRLYDCYHAPVVSIAVLADGSSSWRPQCYERELWGCKQHFKFHTVKVLDYAKEQAALLASDNPFAVVLLAQLIALQTLPDTEQRLELKLQLTKQVLSKALPAQQILDLYLIVDWMLALSPELALKYHNELEKFEEENKVTYITTAERIGRERGLAQGIEQGLEQGLERGLVQGIQRGLRQGEFLMLTRLLQHKFPAISQEMLQRLEQADEWQLLQWADRIIDADSLQEIFTETELVA